jgi:hypothetical protein
MIAFSNQSLDGTTREDTYAVRRILVGRLQRSSRGIPRRERVEQLRRFAEEWTTFLEDGRLPLLRRALAFGPAVASEAGDLWRRSFLLGLACQADSIPAAEPEPAPAASPEPDQIVEPARRRVGSGRNDQGDLFQPGFIAVPVCS